MLRPIETYTHCKDKYPFLYIFLNSTPFFPICIFQVSFMNLDWPENKEMPLLSVDNWYSLLGFQFELEDSLISQAACGSLNMQSWEEKSTSIGYIKFQTVVFIIDIFRSPLDILCYSNNKEMQRPVVKT